MIRKEIDVHLQALAGYINDEDKLVTYKWLSKELGVHVNLAKQILFEYWENPSNEKRGSINATFLLMGYLEDGRMRVEVVKEADLLSAKKNFGKIISEHIYSLQSSLPEIELLAITEKGDSQHSAVRCSESVMRSDHEMDVLRWGSTLWNNKPIKNVQNTTSKVQKPINIETKPVDQTSNVAGKESTAKATAVTKPAEKTQKNAFNNMFAKAIDRQNREKTSGSSDNKKTKEQGKAGAKNSPPKNAWFEAARKTKDVKQDSDLPGLEEKSAKNLVNSDNVKSKVNALSDDSDPPPAKNSWFETKKKPNSRNQQPVTSSGSTESKIKDKKEEEELRDIEVKTDKEASPQKIIGSGKTVRKKKVESSSRGKKRQSSSKSESINKKRKRIVVVESSEESSGSEMEDIREPDSPERLQVIEKVRNTPSPPLVKCEGGRRKVRKLVDKTFVDDDGYFVTQKEYVYESCSDKEEGEVKVDVSIPSTSEPVVKNTHKRKQATLFNFFKKS